MLLFIVGIVCGLFECKWICAGFVVSLVFPCFAMGGHIFKNRMYQIPFIALAPPHIDVYQHTGPECHGHFHVQWFEVRDDFSLCWNRWNSWLSLFIFLFIILTSMNTYLDHDQALWLYNFYFRYRRGKNTNGDTNKQNRQNTSGYRNDAYTNDYSNIGKLFPS